MTPEETDQHVREYLNERFEEVTDFSELTATDLALNNLITLIDTLRAEAAGCDDGPA